AQLPATTRQHVSCHPGGPTCITRLAPLSRQFRATRSWRSFRQLSYVTSQLKPQRAPAHTWPRYFVNQSIPNSNVVHTLRSPTMPVTEQDRPAVRGARDVIGGRGPGSVVVGEETGAAPAGQATDGTDASHIVWHVDPLDGTSNFVQGLAFFCTSIAAEVDGEIRAAAIYDPMADMLYTADGDAAYLNGEAFSTP